MLNMLINDSMSTTDKIMKIAGFIGMVVSITVAFYLIFSASAPDSKTAVFIFSLGSGLALGYLSFAIKQKISKLIKQIHPLMAPLRSHFIFKSTQ